MELKEARNRLESFKSLKKNWDSYGGNPISHTAIKRAKELIDGFFVCPLSDGRVSISLGDEDVTIIIDEQGGVLLEIQ